jgi:hypothetical protein
MAKSSTPFLGIQLAVPGSSEPFRTSDVNAAFDVVDDFAELTDTRLDAMPAAIAAGAAVLTASLAAGTTPVAPTGLSAAVPIAKGGTGLTSLPAGILRSSGTAVSSSALTAADLTAAQQALLVAGKVRAGGVSGGAAVTIFVQSAQPTANAVGDLWFWGS